MHWVLWWMCGLTHISLFGPRNNNAFVFYNRLLLWFKTEKKPNQSHLHSNGLELAKKKSSLTKENICIKWKADEKIFNYVPDWLKYFSASTCQLPLEPVPNGQLPGLRETPGNITSEWCHLPLPLLSLRSSASGSHPYSSSSLFCSAQPFTASQIMELRYCQKVGGCLGVMTWGGTLWQPRYNNASSHRQSRPLGSVFKYFYAFHKRQESFVFILGHIGCMFCRNNNLYTKQWETECVVILFQ